MNRLTMGLLLAVPHVLALLAGGWALLRRPQPTSVSRDVAILLTASCAAGAAGAVCYGLGLSQRSAHATDVAVLGAIVLRCLPIPWARITSSLRRSSR